MKIFSVLLLVLGLSACTTLVTGDAGESTPAARNLCEVMRSWDPFDPAECKPRPGA